MIAFEKLLSLRIQSHHFLPVLCKMPISQTYEHVAVRCEPRIALLLRSMETQAAVRLRCVLSLRHQYALSSQLRRPPHFRQSAFAIPKVVEESVCLTCEGMSTRAGKRGASIAQKDDHEMGRFHGDGWQSPPTVELT